MNFDSNPVPLNSSLFHIEPRVVQDLSVRSTAQSAPPLQIDWYGPSGPSTLYMVSTQSNPMTSTSGNSLYGVQRFFQEFRLPDFTLDSFSGRLLDVVSSTTFSSGDVQVELRHAITRLMAFCIYILQILDHLILSYFILGPQILSVILSLSFFLNMFRLFDILEPGMCHFIDRETGLSRTLPSTDAFHLGYEIVRGDRQHLKKQLLVSVLDLSYMSKF